MIVATITLIKLPPSNFRLNIGLPYIFLGFAYWISTETHYRQKVKFVTISRLWTIVLPIALAIIAILIYIPYILASPSEIILYN